MKRIRYLISLMYICVLPLHAGMRIGGNITDSSAFASFSFPIGHIARSHNGQTFFGARDDITNPEAQPFAVSQLTLGGTQCAPLTPETVILNGTDDTPNPLHGAAISHLASLQDMPLVVAGAQPNRLNLIMHNGRAVLQTDVLRNDDDEDVASIIGVHTIGTSFAAAVEPNGGSFGDDGSGIAFGSLSHDENQELQLEQKQDEFLSITTTTPQLTYNNRELAQIHNSSNQPVVFTTLSNNAISYAGFSVTSGSVADAGARSILVGRNVPIIPESALTDDAIVGTTQPNTEVWVHNIETAVTSTRLTYMIINGGVGSSDATRRQVFALPLVNDINSAGFATVAARGVEPEPQFNNDAFNGFSGLSLRTQAASPETMWRPDDADVHVGGDRNLPGAITDLWVEKDAVFVAIPEIDDGATLPAGVYYSQALFNAHGRIIGWTDWAPTADTANTPVARVVYEASLGQYLLVTQDVDSEPTRVSRTQLERENVPYATIANAIVQPGGIQGVVDIPYTHPALSDVVGQRMSLTIATGLQTVVIAQDARDENNVLIPQHDITLTRQASGAVTTGPTDGFVVTGGDIDELGAIITADIGTDGNDGWLVVGGSDGVAVLQADDGSGWPADGLEADFANLPDLRFVRIPGITLVRSLAISDSNLFVLTQNALYRIPLQRNNFAQTSPTIYTVADAQTICGDDATFSDVVVSGSRAILATSCGLFATAQSGDINVQVISSENAWQHIDLPESVEPITRLYAVSPTHMVQDIATTARGGAIYVVNAAVSTFQTQIYRLAITPESGNGRSPEPVVRLYPDYFTQRTQSYFVSRGDYRNAVFFDGSACVLTRSRYMPDREQPLFVELLPANVRSGIPFIAEQSGRFFEVTQSPRIEQPLRSSASGALLFYGSFGMYVQQ